MVLPGIGIKEETEEEGALRAIEESRSKEFAFSFCVILSNTNVQNPNSGSKNTVII